MSHKSTKNVIFYVDGLNLYYGLKHNKWKKYYWLNITKFCLSFLKPYQIPIKIRYFNSPPKEKQKKIIRYKRFIQANKTENLFEITEGVHVKKVIERIIPPNNNPISFSTYEEKETDVNIALAMIKDAIIEKVNDISILISADSDFVPVIKAIKEYNPGHRIFVYFPPTYFSSELAHLSKPLNLIRYTLLERHENNFKNNLFPDKIKLLNGTEIEKPLNWI